MVCGILLEPTHKDNEQNQGIRNYLWSGEDEERSCRAKVAWSSLILPKELGGLKFMDLELKIKALIAKLFIRGLLPSNAPWKCLIMHIIKNLSPKRGGKWPAHIQFILFSTNVRGAGSDIWWEIRKAWISVRP